MTDNVTLPGTGERVASRDVSYSGETASMQVVGLATLAGADDAKVPTDVSPSAPLPVEAYGELVEALEALRIATSSLTKSIGFALPNLLGQPIFEARQATAANLQVTVGSIAGGQTLGTVTTVSTVTNQAQVGGFAGNDQIPALMHLQADGLRANITVT
jgi:hypothetical protein